MPKHSSCLFLFLLVILFLPGCEEAKAPQGGLASVVFLEVQPRSVTLSTELPGRTSAYMVAEVRPQVSGIIQERLFVEGSDVKEGDILYQIDPAIYQAAYDNAKATLMRAEANEVAAGLLAERYRQVVRVSAVSKQEYDNAVAAHGQAKADVAAAKAALESARINLDYTQVKAPVSGRIGRSAVTQGALVTQNQPMALATVQQLDPMYVDVTQSSSELLRLRRDFSSGALISSGETAMQATLKLEDGTTYMRRVPGDTRQEMKPVIGTLKFSEVTVEQSTGAVTIRAVFPNPEGTLLPGMYVRAVLEEGVSERAIMIPQKAVSRNNRGLPLVQKLTKNATLQDQEGVYNVTPQMITVDRSIDNQWLVTDGLKEGDRVIIEGLMRVRPGVPVKALPEAESGAAGSVVPAKN
ncbi:MAG: efflux RND transporter periplasmic adaptor subunit [Desulfovibrionaceae bacterium]|nr:efflux RND transporter periplasmic adaptor subunit [Desulfovibrionaceae bacterium]